MILTYLLEIFQGDAILESDRALLSLFIVPEVRRILQEANFGYRLDQNVTYLAGPDFYRSLLYTLDDLLTHPECYHPTDTRQMTINFLTRLTDALASCRGTTWIRISL